MSWGIDLVTDKDVPEATIDEICSDLPEWMLGPFGSKQPWGWSLAVDLWLDSPRPKTVILTGAGFSRNAAPQFAEAFARRLEQKGFKVEIGEMT